VDSISISGHKMIGSPIPCGVALAKRSNVDRIARSVEYVGTLDTTLAGSRNGITPLFLWYAFHTVGFEGLRRRVRACFEVADYAIEQFRRIGRNAWRHHNSVTVVFARPQPQTIQKWQLAVHQEIAHIITMPHVTRATIDQLIDDIARESPNLAREDVHL